VDSQGVKTPLSFDATFDLGLKPQGYCG